jgi:hypothetical protein
VTCLSVDAVETFDSLDRTDRRCATGLHECPNVIDLASYGSVIAVQVPAAHENNVEVVVLETVNKPV